LRTALADARSQLADRDLVAQAKLLLMNRHQLSEPQAYARLRKTAMNHGLPLPEVARRVMELADLFD
jgi:two-component system, response regulator / RNA-binding antiterminator